MNIIEQLTELREYGGAIRTRGLDDATIERLAAHHPDLVAAADAALERHRALRSDLDILLRMDEEKQIHAVQADFVNFYSEDAVNPYVALSARGPWIVTAKGAVIHDSGGYGMLGFGHNPQAVDQVLAMPQVMANIMTPSFSHYRLGQVLRAEIGQRRGGCPFARFFCLNSGSEAVTLAGRLADVNARINTDASGRHTGKRIKRIAVRGSFHGRTEHPALYSDSSRKVYLQHLASYRQQAESLIVVEPYSVESLKKAFADAEANNWFIEAVFLEPVMGEGDPGRALTREFYAAARQLTLAHGTLLLIDSIQAGLRAHGVLSIVDYPGFEALEAPDMETYSKALNAGQYPMSVLAVTERAMGLYKKGLYGNTMTTNPRAMEVAVAVLKSLIPELRQNIVIRGRQFLDRLHALKTDLGGLITKVQGTGLLFSCELSPVFKCFGTGSIEEYLREHGIGVIHGGANSLRFTPHFAIGDDEMDVMLSHLREALLHGPRKEHAEAA